MGHILTLTIVCTIANMLTICILSSVDVPTLVIIDSIPLLFIASPLPYILLSTSINVRSYSMLLIVGPLAFIPIAAILSRYIASIAMGEPFFSLDLANVPSSIFVIDYLKLDIIYINVIFSFIR